MLRADGFAVNHKRVGRLWRREGLSVPARRPKERLNAEPFDTRLDARVMAGR